MAQISPTGPFCPPHTPGELWQPKHGVRLATGHELWARYLHNEARFSDWCERHSIPTGVPIPREVFEAASRAYSFRPCHWNVVNLDELRRLEAEDEATRQRMIADIHAMLAEAAARVAADAQPMLLAAE